MVDPQFAQLCSEFFYIWGGQRPCEPYILWLVDLEQIVLCFNL